MRQPTPSQPRAHGASGRLRRLALLLASAVLLLSDVARAVAAPSGDWKPYQPDQAQEVSAPLFVVLAYSAIWIALLIFVLSVWNRQRKLEAEIRELRRQLGGRS